MNAAKHIVVIAGLLVAALACRLFGPKGELTWLSSDGTSRGIFPVNLLAFWFLIVLAVLLTLLLLGRRSHSPNANSR
jgi:hypothetical protein